MTTFNYAAHHSISSLRGQSRNIEACKNVRTSQKLFIKDVALLDMSSTDAIVYKITLIETDDFLKYLKVLYTVMLYVQFVNR